MAETDSLVKELADLLQRYKNCYPAFRVRPIGSPGSPMRIEQERLMALEEQATALIKKARS